MFSETSVFQQQTRRKGSRLRSEKVIESVGFTVQILPSTACPTRPGPGTHIGERFCLQSMRVPVLQSAERGTVQAQSCLLLTSEIDICRAGLRPPLT